MSPAGANDLDVCRQAVTENPDSPAAHLALGVALRHAGDLDGSRVELVQAVERAPAVPETHSELGLTLAAQGNTEVAAKAFAQALALQPGSAVAHTNYGAALIRLDRVEEGIAHFRKAMAADPNFSGAATNLGVALNMLDRPEAALAALKAALAQNPDDALAVTASGDALQMLGDIPAALDAYARALALDPRAPSAYRRLFSEMGKVPSDDPRVAALWDLAKSEERFSDADKAELHIALYAVCRSAGRYREAFSHLLAGNAARRRTLCYDEADTLSGLRAMAETCPAGLLSARAGAGDPSDVPVFVVGMPRSGTTLVEQILASHPGVFGAGEQKTLEDLVCCGSRPAFDPARISDGDLKRLGGRYVRALRALAPGATRIVDKMPWNFRLIGLIRLILPNARIVHVMRDPLDTCLSCFSLLFRRDLAYTCDLSELGRYYKAYRDLMAHWRTALPQGAMLELQYEDLVTDFDANARKLLTYCGLDWDERCRTFYETRRSVHTASAMQVRRPIYAHAIGRWKHYAAELTPLRNILGI